MPTEPPNQEPASAPLQAPSVAAVVVQGVSTMMMMMVVLEQEEGAVMQEGAPSPSLPPSLQSRLIDLPTTLPFKMTFKKKKRVSLRV